MEILEIGGTPADEPCAQTAATNYEFSDLNRVECQAYVMALRRKYGEPPDGAEYLIKANPHDFGTYREVVIRFDPDIPAAVQYAEKVERGLSLWEEADMWPPVTYDDRGNAVNILRKPQSWDRTNNPEARELD